MIRFEHAVFAAALRRLRSYSEAQELCQEVFVQAFEKIHQLRVPECFAGWLRSITNRMTINRAVRRPPAVATEPDALAARCVEHLGHNRNGATGEENRGHYVEMKTVDL